MKLHFPKIEGPAPQFWEKAPPLKNGQFRGQKHLENVPTFFYSFITYTKFTFCKKFGPNRPIQTSAVVRIFYCRLYGVPTLCYISQPRQQRNIAQQCARLPVTLLLKYLNRKRKGLLNNSLLLKCLEM